jgi:hypothetical protein
MHLATLLEMIESGYDERVLLGSVSDRPVTGAQLGKLARSAGVDDTEQTHDSRTYRRAR